MLFKTINKEDIMKSKEDIDASTVEAFDVTRNRPGWMMDKPKTIEKVHIFSVTFDEGTKELSLIVNGDVYRKMPVKDKLSGTVKFHEGIDQMIKLFRDWGFYENSN